MTIIGDFWRARRARYQADALRDVAEARRHERRAKLAAQPVKSRLDLAEMTLLESASLSGLGWNDQIGVFKDLLTQFTDFSRGGFGAGSGITNHTNRRGGDFPFITSEAHLAAHRDLSRLVIGSNDNAKGLLGANRRYTIGTGATVRIVAKGDEFKADAAAAQACVDQFAKANRFAFRQREYFTRASRDGEGIFRLFPQADGCTDLRFVWPEQIRRPADVPDGYEQPDCEYGRITEPGDAEVTAGWAVHPTDTSEGRDALAADFVPPEEIVYLGWNADTGVKRSLPDFTLGTGETLELADDLAKNMGQGSALQAAIAYVMQHTGTPKETIRARGFADASYTRTDPYTGQDVPVKKFQPGTIVETNENTEFLGSPYNAGVQAHIDVFQMLVRRAEARWNAPEWLATSYSQEVNFASSLTAESPYVNTVREMQEYVSDAFRTLFERVLAVAAAAGQLPDDILARVEVRVTFPNPQARDGLKEAQRAAIELANGTTSPQLEAEAAGREWDKILKDTAAAKAAGWQPPSQGAKPPGAGGTPGEPGAGPDDPPPKAPPTPAKESLQEAILTALLEHGFTGTDRLGRKWVDGKEVKKDQAGGGGEGGGGTSSPSPVPSGAPSASHVFGDVHDALPDAVKADPGVVAKVRRLVGIAYEAAWGFLATQGHDLIPEILDTAEDYQSIAYAKHGAQGQAVGDPFYEHLGVPYSAVSVVVSKVIAAAAGYVKGKLTAQEAMEAILEALSDDQRQAVAAGAAGLVAEILKAWGVEGKVPAPSAEDVAKRMGERSAAAGS